MGKVKATEKQSKAINYLVDDGGNNVGQAMVKAGYSKATAKTPQKLTGSKAFKQYEEQTKTIALKKYDITWDLIIAKLYTKLMATRKDITGDIVENDNVQMAAIKLLIGLMDSHTQDEPQPQATLNIPKDMNEVELQSLVFRKSNE